MISHVYEKITTLWHELEFDLVCHLKHQPFLMIINGKIAL